MGLTIREVSNILGIPYRTWQDWEGGKRSPSDWVVKLILFRLENMEEEKMKDITVVQDTNGNVYVRETTNSFQGMGDCIDWAEECGYTITEIEEGDVPWDEEGYPIWWK